MANTNSSVASTAAKYNFKKRSDSFGKVTQNCSQAFYDLPDIWNGRATGMGYGGRHEFGKIKEEVPSPTSYALKSGFHKIYSRAPSFSFGASRSAYDKVYNEKHTLNLDKNIPGPGSYAVKNDFGKEAQKFSFLARTKPLDEFRSRRITPGPGAYDSTACIDPTGNYFSSKYKNSNAPKISPRRSTKERGKSTPRLRGIPGPGEYNVKDVLDPIGKQFISKYKSSLAPSLKLSEDRFKPVLKQSKMTPGPGTYQLKSCFGPLSSDLAKIGNMTART